MNAAEILKLRQPMRNKEINRVTCTREDVTVTMKKKNVLLGLAHFKNIRERMQKRFMKQYCVLRGTEEDLG